MFNSVKLRKKKREINRKIVPSFKEKQLQKHCRFIEQIYHEFQYQNLEDFIYVPRTRIKSILYTKTYKKDLSLLLQTVYPNYPWQFQDKEKIKYEKFKSIEEQRTFMQNLFQILQLKTMNEWTSLPRAIFIEKGGKGLLYYYYKGDFELLLSSVYPNYPWPSKSNFNSNRKFNLKSLSSQSLFLSRLFIKFKLKSLSDWSFVPIKKIKKQGGGRMIKYYYQNNLQQMFQTIYPNFPWNFEEIKKEEKEKMKITRYRHRFADRLFKKLKLKTMEDWERVTKIDICSMGGEIFLQYYKGNKYEMARSIYVNYPWVIRSANQNNIEENIHRFLLISQRKKMEKHFFSHHFTSLDDWLEKKSLKKVGGVLFNNFYLKDRKRFLSDIYPNYAWNFNNINEKIKIENEKLIDRLYARLKLRSLDDWLKVSKKEIRKEKGGRKMIRYFDGDFLKLLKNIYPNYAWDFSSLKLWKTKFHSLEDQRNFMDYLFTTLNLSSFDHFLSLSFVHFTQKGEEKLYKYYQNYLNYYYKSDLKILLPTLYPNFPWNFASPFFRGFFRSKENQQNLIIQIFYQLNLTSLDDWIKIKPIVIKRNGGKKLLMRYSDDVSSLLLSLFPNYPWRFPIDNSSLMKNEWKIKEWIEKYKITEKKDWYRLPLDFAEKFSVFATLKQVFPTEEWKISNFKIRGKKSSQRLLFSLSHKLFPSFLIIENYFHPQLVHSNHYELDLFIPSLHLALEYQGEHHYDDIPRGFAGVELFQDRDKLKENLASSLSLKIIYIPYWWNFSLSSLHSFIFSNQTQFT